MADAEFPATPGRASMPAWYPELLDSISGRIERGRLRAVRAANAELLAANWAIGRDILDRQDREGWGAKVIDRLASDLRERFPDARGFSPRNLKYMRALAEAWSQEAIVQAPLAQLPWYHHLALLTKVKDEHTRRWYAAAAVEYGWSRDVLALQIDSRLHERSGRAISNFHAALPEPDSDLAQQSTKDPYIFDFLGLTDLRREREIEAALVRNLSRFLLELGQGFAFVGQQVRLVLGGEEFVCDLIFYHLHLRRYIVIELKAVAFKPEFLGQLGMYQAAVDDLLARPDDGPTLGLLLCRNKNNVVAEYALRGYAAPMGVAEWHTHPSTQLPTELAANLPTVEQLEAELALEPWDDLT